MTDNRTLWHTKLAARIHDPAEKALVLLRDPAGHEGGTSRALSRLLGLSEVDSESIDRDSEADLSSVAFKAGLERSLYRHVQRGDWWASAADRPQWPMEEITTPSGRTFKVADWAQVRWTQQPVLIHPLTGQHFDLGRQGGLRDTDIAEIKQRSFDHFSQLLNSLRKAGDADDPRQSLLTFWRFGPELDEENDNEKLGALWRLLPADTRIPDHSIWDHLDLTSAFAGAFADDPEDEVALLALSIGPVQGFIAAARTTSDLWAGSHLLSRLAWEAMKPVCAALGPDAILFPRLRGIPQVDLWLRDEMGLPRDLFRKCAWTKGGTDANPLFSAALPNRFVAVVPASKARQIAEQVTDAVRQWLQKLGQTVVKRLLEVADLSGEGEQHCHRQMREQLAGFPEVHWAAVPFSLIHPRNEARQTDLDVSALSSAMAPFFGAAANEGSGFLETNAWKTLSQSIDWGDNTAFFAPNPGVLYPAIYDLAERVLAAAKATRAFAQNAHSGWRCSLTGETEWLTTDPNHLAIPAGKRRSREDKQFREGEHTETLWTRVADKKPAWARKGEHLGALPAIKRLWPTLFVDEVRQALGGDVGRFVVSTHTMALAHQLDQWLEHGGHTDSDLAFVLKRYRAEPVALPNRLMRRHYANREALDDAKRILGLLELAGEADVDEQEASAINRAVRQTLGTSKDKKNEVKLEAYYALLMMDGDRMGAILSGDENTAISYRASFHPQVQKGFDEHAVRQARIRQYGAQKRAISPNRHLAISGALNDFSQTVVRHVIETEYLGRVIYAGGDDVLAMLPVADLLSTMQRLRHAYSGHDPEHPGGVSGLLTLHNGFAILRTGHAEKERLQLMRMMGANATASCGAVIAHHQAPLSAVLRGLREAEKRAKAYRRPGPDGRAIDRNAFHLTVIKRSGGSLQLSAEWGEPLSLLSDLRAFLTGDGTSRRAVYNSLEWLKDLPDPKGNPELLAALLAYQLARQSQGQDKDSAPHLAQRLAQLAADQPRDGLCWLSNFLSVAEFLARETRTGGES